MTLERPTHWYRQWYVHVCVVVTLVGIGLIGGDLRSSRMKQVLLSAKVEADRLQSSQEHEQAVARDDAMLDQAELRKALESQIVSDGAMRSRDQAEVQSSQEQARLLAEQNQQRERAEAVRRSQKLAEANAKIEQSTDYQHLSRKAREHEREHPGIASRYYQDIVKQFPGTAQAKAAEAKAQDLWRLAYGGRVPDLNSDETDPSGAHASSVGSASSIGRSRSSSASSSSYVGVCGAPTRRGGSCQRTVRGGGRCYQH